MLVISRKAGERILIGENVWVTVVRLEGNRIRLGIDAPLEIPVRRAEIVEDSTGPLLPQPLGRGARLSPHPN